MGKSALITVTLLLLAACRGEETTGYELDDGTLVQMTTSPMSRIKTERYRTFVLQGEGKTISQKLLEDMGWWDGSNLYRHSSGAYVLHEGKVGCFYFTTRPLAIRTDLDISCKKHVLGQLGRKNNTYGPSLIYPPSNHYREFSYIGRFMINADNNVQFVPFTEQSEVELPQISVRR